MKFKPNRALYERKNLEALKKLAASDPEIVVLQAGDHVRLVRGDARVEYWPGTGTAGCHDTNQWPHLMQPHEVISWLRELDSPYLEKSINA